jgi:hypothetical protein
MSECERNLLLPVICSAAAAGFERDTPIFGAAVLPFVGLWPLGTIIIEAEEGSSFLWFASIQGIEGKQDLADLAPKGCFIAAEAIEREVG